MSLRSTRRRVLLFALLILFGAKDLARHHLAHAKDEKPPKRLTLPIEMRPQETELWCWAATGQMTMEFLGTTVSQSDQANTLFKRTDCDDRPVPKPCIRGGAVLLAPFGFTADISLQPLSEDEIVRQLHALKKPVPFGRQWPGGGGHICLVVGYLKTDDGRLLLEVLDPFPPPGRSKESKEGGQRMLVPYKRWAGADAESKFHHALYNVKKTPAREGK